MQYSCAQNAMKPEIAACRAGNFGRVGPTIGRQRAKNKRVSKKAGNYRSQTGKPGRKPTFVL